MFENMYNLFMNNLSIPTDVREIPSIDMVIPNDVPAKEGEHPVFLNSERQLMHLNKQVNETNDIKKTNEINAALEDADEFNLETRINVSEILKNKEYVEAAVKTIAELKSSSPVDEETATMRTTVLGLADLYTKPAYHEMKIIIDENRRKKEAEEITETEFFSELKTKTAQIRRERGTQPTPATEVTPTVQEKTEVKQPARASELPNEELLNLESKLQSSAEKDKLLTIVTQAQKRLDASSLNEATRAAYQIVISAAETKIKGPTIEAQEQVQPIESGHLKIEIDEAKRKAQVDTIVEADWFRDLKAKAAQMRASHKKEEPVTA